MPATESECIHGLEPMTCSICKARLGYRPGSLRHRNDCTVVSVQNLTGATYAEALELMEAAGRKGGQGAYCEQVRAALAAAGWTCTPSSMDLPSAIRSGRTFLVSAHRRNGGHSYAIQGGKALNAGDWTQGVRYRLWEVA